MTEMLAGLNFLGDQPGAWSLASSPEKQPSAWDRYVQVLLSSNELLYVN